MDNLVVVDEEKRKAKFKMDSRLITQILGSEIIESHSIAFAEQIKNAKDAGATNVVIDLSKIDNGLITIEDNGKGMTYNELKDNWFMLGKSDKYLDFNTSGGKGIGRLSLFKIGKKFEIETSTNNELSIFSISEKELKEENSEEFEIDIITKKEIENSGTKILVSEIDKDISLEEIEIELENIKTSENILDLKILYPANYKEKEFLEPKDVKDVVPFFADIYIDFSNLTSVADIAYSFKSQMNNEILYKNNKFFPKFEKQIYELITNNYKALSIGKFRFTLNNFFFDRAVVKYIPKTAKEKDIRSHFLKAYQGINIYRNGFKIYGHGSEDWLKLAENRLARSGENIDNKQTFGMIFLDNEESLELKEKSNREGFIRNPTSKAFRELVLLIVKQFGQDSASAKKIIKEKVKELDRSSEGEKRIEQYQSELEVKNSFPSVLENVKTSTDTLENKNNRSNQSEELKETYIINEKKDNNNSTEQFRRKISNRLHPIDKDVYDKMRICKCHDLLNEIQSININTHTYATAYLLRALIESLMNQFIISNYEEIKDKFPNYEISEDKIILKFDKNKKSDINNKKKISDFKKYFKKIGKFQDRSLNHLDKLAIFIDDLNLTTHWTDKTVSINEISTQWQNSTFFIEYLCSNI